MEGSRQTQTYVEVEVTLKDVAFALSQTISNELEVHIPPTTILKDLANQWELANTEGAVIYHNTSTPKQEL